MNILLIRPKPHKDSIGLQSFMICEPLELEYVYSYMESFGHNVTIVDMILERKPIKYFINKYKPDVVGFTSYITHVGVVKQYAKEVKDINEKCIVIVGGVHAEVVSEDFEDKNIDYILKVNGLKTFKEIVDNIEKPVEINKQEIKGVWKDSNKEYAIDTEFEFPHPNRESTKRYRNKYNYIYHSKCATLKTSFGCPYKCEFCFCIKITQNKYFEREMEDVIEELKSIKEKNVFVVDDNFLLRRERVKEFCRLIKENNINKNYILFGRTDFVTNNEDLIEELYSIGVVGVFIGIESFKGKDLDSYNKNIKVQENVKAVEILQKYDIQCYTGMIVSPDWSKEDFDNNIKWLRYFKKPISANILPLTPMPGTVTFEKMKEDIEVPREKYELWDLTHSIVKTKNMSRNMYYYNILRTYFKTSASVEATTYILKKYGFRIYFNVVKSGIYVVYQYIKLIIKDNKRNKNEQVRGMGKTSTQI